MKPFLLTDYFDQAAERWGDRVAMEDVNVAVTYRQLWEKSRNFARFLSRQEEQTTSPIGLYFPKGIPCVTAMMGVLYHGGSYTPLDVRAPFSYVEKALDVLECEWILTDNLGEQALKKAGARQRIFNLDQIEAQAESQRLAVRKPLDCDPAFFLFTSGSTGVPKGVAISHRRVMDYISWAADFFDCDSQTVIGNQAPFLFTVSVMDLYLCFYAGARLCLIPEHTLATPTILVDFLKEKRITFIFWVPSVYANVWKSGALSDVSLPDLRQGLFVGEPMPPYVINGWISRLSHVKFYNLYGSTETDMTLCYPVIGEQTEGEGIPLGKPRKNVEAFLLDGDRQVTHPGKMGEICIRGTTLANGYWNNAEKTAQAFGENPCNPHYPEIIYRTGDLGSWDPNGNLHFHGRKDHQFKHLGYRLEANGIEEIALSSGMIHEACIQYDAGKQQIVLFYIPSESWEPREFRRFLMGAMPAYMLPTRMIELDRMPRTISGKRDRVLLQKQYLEGKEGGE